MCVYIKTLVSSARTLGIARWWRWGNNVKEKRGEKKGGKKVRPQSSYDFFLYTHTHEYVGDGFVPAVIIKFLRGCDYIARGSSPPDVYVDDVSRPARKAPPPSER